MNPSSRDRISVDLRGLKTALVERARSLGLTPSNFVRELLVASLQGATSSPASRPSAPCDPPNRTRLCLRMTRDEARATLDGARSAGASPGAFVAGLVANVPVLARGSSRGELIALLTAANAELAALSRNLHHLATLLRQGAWRAADEYRPMLDTLSGDVRAHLESATRALRDLQPARAAMPPPSAGRRA
jgi:hypothetical protein